MLTYGHVISDMDNGTWLSMYDSVTNKFCDIALLEPKMKEDEPDVWLPLSSRRRCKWYDLESDDEFKVTMTEEDAMAILFLGAL